MIATPTSFDSVKYCFNMNHIEDVANLAWKVKQNITMVINRIVLIDSNRNLCL